jgi:hypothetical protein
VQSKRADVQNVDNVRTTTPLAMQTKVICIKFCKMVMAADLVGPVVKPGFGGHVTDLTDLSVSGDMLLIPWTRFPLRSFGLAIDIEHPAAALDMWTTRYREFSHIPTAQQQQPFPHEIRW